MRLFLGITWIYAGWDKASDPGFLKAGSSTFIGTQLSAYSVNSPIGFILNKFSENSTQIGIIIMLAEFAIGAATLLWIAPTWAAFGGFAMSLTLWLASTWNVKPYFLASNSAYTILWLSYFLFLYGSRRRSKVSLDRRGFIRGTTVAAIAIAGAGLGRGCFEVGQRRPHGQSVGNHRLIFRPFKLQRRGGDPAPFAFALGHRHRRHHTTCHVIQVVAVQEPLPRLVEIHRHRHHTPRWHHHHIAPWPVKAAKAKVDHLEMMPVQVHRVHHHGGVHEHHLNPRA